MFDILLLVWQELETNEIKILDSLEKLTDECEHLKAREKSLMADIKKRGDAARQLVMAKDEEIHKLQSKLSNSPILAPNNTSTKTSVDSKEPSENNIASSDSSEAPSSTALHPVRLRSCFGFIALIRVFCQ